MYVGLVGGRYGALVMNDRDVVCCLKGRLGNQLFEYAAAFSVAYQTGGQVKIYRKQVDAEEKGPYVLDKIIKDYHEIDAIIPRNKWQNWLNRKELSKRLYVERSATIYDPLVNQKLQPPVQMHGHFASFRYVLPCEKVFREQFTWPIQSEEVIQTLVHMREGAMSVGVHVRRTDYLTDFLSQVCGLSELSLDYYKRAVALLKACLGDQVHFYIFTDDPNYVHSCFDFCPDKTVLGPENHLSYEAMYLMSQCDHMIIANSTFSWWGAWLNPSLDQYVIAPRAWYNDRMSRHINIRHLLDFIPEHWICV